MKDGLELYERLAEVLGVLASGYEGGARLDNAHHLLELFLVAIMPCGGKGIYQVQLPSFSIIFGFRKLPHPHLFNSL